MPQGTTTTDTIFSEGFNQANFDSFVVSETHDVVAGKNKDPLARVDNLGLPVGPFAPETTGTEATSAVLLE